MAKKKTPKKKMAKSKPGKKSVVAKKVVTRKAAKKKTVRQTAARKTAAKKKIATPRAVKETAPVGATPKKRAPAMPTPAMPASKTPAPKPPRRFPGPPPVEADEGPQGVGSAAGGQAGDLQGLSRKPTANSESVEELVEEGQAWEASAISGVEDNEGNPTEVHTHEVREDDVPEEYLNDRENE